LGRSFWGKIEMNILETDNNTPIGTYAPDFELLGTDHQVHHLSRYLERFSIICVISMSNNCDYVEMYLDRIRSIQLEFATNSFTLIGLNGNETNDPTGSTFDKMKIFAHKKELNFPYLWDSTQDVMRSFGVESTPTAFLIDQSGVVRYKGQIDDHPQDESITGQDYLRSAIACLLNNEEIRIGQTEQIGTAVVWRNIERR